MILRKRKERKSELIDEILNEIKDKTKILVFTGAGLSSSSGKNNHVGFW